MDGIIGCGTCGEDLTDNDLNLYDEDGDAMYNKCIKAVIKRNEALRAAVENNKKECFLGGTCNGSDWRDELIGLVDNPVIKFFNPIVKIWNKEVRELEGEKKESCDYNIYVITPRMKGIYSIAELVEDSIRFPSTTLVVFIYTDGSFMFDDEKWASIKATIELISKYNTNIFTNLENLALFLENVG